MAYRVKLPPEGTPETLYTGSHIFGKAVTSVTSVTSKDEPSSRGDVYGQLADKALKRICARPYLPGAIAWLKRVNLPLHRMLTRDLPRQIDKLWDAQDSLDHFQAVLDFWVDTHQDAIDQYLKAIGNGKTSAPSKGQILTSHEESGIQVNKST